MSDTFQPSAVRPTLDELRLELETENANKPKCIEHDWTQKLSGWLCRKCSTFTASTPSLKGEK